MNKMIHSTTAYEGVIFSVTHDEVEIENGSIAYRDVVHHHGGVGILAKRNNELLLVSQYRYATQQTLWEIPAGKLEKDEDPYTCGLRELEEESGYTSNALTLVTTFYSTPGFCSEKLYIYETEQLKKVEHPLPMDEDECITTAWFPIQKAYAMVKDGTIQDAKTIIAIQHAYMNMLEHTNK